MPSSPPFPAARQHLALLREVLTGAVEGAAARGLSRARLSRSLGHHPYYVGRVLKGERPLKVEKTFALLEAVGLDAREVLPLNFPLGGAAARVPLLQTHRDPHRLAPGVGLWRRAGRAAPLAPPAVLAEQAREVLRRRVRTSPLTLADLDERLRPVLGVGVANSLHGTTDLTFERVFPILEAVGCAPGRFLAEVLFLETGDEVERWAEVLDLLEEESRLASRSAEKRAGGSS